MCYESISELPDSVRDHVSSDEEVAEKVAWSAGKKQHSKGEEGDWHVR